MAFAMLSLKHAILKNVKYFIADSAIYIFSG